MRILLTGATGQVGWELARRLPALECVEDVVMPGRDALDLARIESIEETVRSVRPDLVVNAAAYTAVDQAESEPELAELANATAPGVLARAAADVGAAVVHYSTDYVFDGAATRPYEPDDPTAPLNVYGRTKLAGEQAVLASGARGLVLRTSWVYSDRGRNFLRTIRRLASERDELRIVDDQIGTPTSAAVVASLTAGLLATRPFDGSDGAPSIDVHHVACRGSTTWCGFARRIVQLMAGGWKETIPSHRPMPAVHAITTDDYPTPAARPRYSVLSTERFERTFGLRPPHWEDALDAHMSSSNAPA